MAAARNKRLRDGAARSACRALNSRRARADATTWPSSLRRAESRRSRLRRRESASAALAAAVALESTLRKAGHCEAGVVGEFGARFEVGGVLDAQVDEAIGDGASLDRGSGDRRATRCRHVSSRPCALACGGGRRRGGNRGHRRGQGCGCDLLERADEVAVPSADAIRVLVAEAGEGDGEGGSGEGGAAVALFAAASRVLRKFFLARYAHIQARQAAVAASQRRRPPPPPPPRRRTWRSSVFEMALADWHDARSETRRGRRER